MKQGDRGDHPTAAAAATPSSTVAASVFVSYPREHAAFVEALTEALEARGISTWVDLRGIPPGSPQWREDMRSAVRGNDAFVCVLSPAAVQSDSCLEEMRYAVEMRKKLIVLMREHPGEAHRAPAEIAASNWILAGPDRALEDVVTRLHVALLVDYEWTRVHTRLLVRANEWEASGESRTRLLVGDDLADVERAVDRHGSSPLQPVLDLQRSFVKASRRAARRGRRWRTGLTLAVFAGLSTLLAFALIQRSQAIGERDTAISRELATSSADRLTSDPALAVTLARLAVERKRTPQAEIALQRSLVGSHIERTLMTRRPPSSGSPIALTAAGLSVVLANGADVDSHIVNLSTHRDVVVPTGTGNGGGLDFAQFSRDGRRLLTMDYNQNAKVWDTASGKALGGWQLGNVRLTQAVFRANLVYLVTRDGDVFAYDLHGRRVDTPPLLAKGHAIAISDDAQTVLQGGNNATLLLARGDRRVQLSSRGRELTAAFAPDGARVAIAFPDRFELWAVDRPRRLLSAPLGEIAFSRDSRGFLDVGRDGVLRRYDAHTGRLTRRVPGFPAQIAIIDPVGAGDEHVVIADEDGQIAVWEARSRTTPLARYLFERRPTVSGQALANARAYSVGQGQAPNSQVLSLWDLRDGTLLARRDLPPASGSPSVDPSGRFAVNSLGDGKVAVVPLRGGPAQQVEGGNAAFSGDGKHLIVTGPRRLSWLRLPGLVRESSVETKEPDATVLEISGDGRRVAVGSAEGLEVYDRESGDLKFHAAGGALAFTQGMTADGGLIAVQSGQTVRVVSGSSGRLLRVYPPIKAGALSPYGEVLAIGDDRSLTLWNAVAGERILTVPLSRPVSEVSFTPDGATVMVITDDGSTMLYECGACRPTDTLLRDARQRVARPLTAAERDSYLSG